MYEDIKFMPLLAEMKRATGSNARLAAEIGVVEKTVSTWIGRPEDSLHRLTQAHMGQILAAARNLGIRIESFMEGPRLWRVDESYEENLSDPGMPSLTPQPTIHERLEFLGFPLNSPFGASASVLTANSFKIRFLAHAGADVLTHKTVRSRELGGHPAPNIYQCTDEKPKLDPGKSIGSVLVDLPTEQDRPVLGMLNRFGMPSTSPEIWQADFRAATNSLMQGQLLILSVVGTADPKDPPKVLIEDFVHVVELAIQANARVIELNLSCPNCSGMEGSVYQNRRLVREICKQVYQVRQNSKILLKIGYLAEPQLSEFVDSTAEFVDGYSAINTVSVLAERRGQFGSIPAFGPGVRAGLSGAPILRMGLKCVQDLVQIREKEGLKYVIIGIGGITSEQDVQTYLSSGADVVQATTAFFIDSYFGMKVRRFLRSQDDSKESIERNQRHLAIARFLEAIGEIEDEFGGPDSFGASSLKAALGSYCEWYENYRSEFRDRAARKPKIPTVREFKKGIRTAARPNPTNQ